MSNLVSVPGPKESDSLLTESLPGVVVVSEFRLAGLSNFKQVQYLQSIEQNKTNGKE